MDGIFETELIIRKLNKNDKDIFIKLRMAYIKETYKKVNLTELKQIESNLNKYFDKHINKDDFIGIIGEYNKNIVSAAYLIINDFPANPKIITGRAGTLINVYTFPEYRKKGFAAKLIEEIIKEAKIKGISRIDLKATEDGYNLYKNIGFIDDNDCKSMYLPYLQ